MNKNLIPPPQKILVKGMNTEGQWPAVVKLMEQYSEGLEFPCEAEFVGLNDEQDRSRIYRLPNGVELVTQHLVYEKIPKENTEDRITEQNLVGVKRSSDSYFFKLIDGQFWKITEKMVEVHDQNGKVQGFRKRSIQYAETKDQIILQPFV